MAIDAHQHPLFFRDLCPDAKTVEVRKGQQAYYKMGVQDVGRVIEQNRINGVERSVLLPHDFSHYQGDRIANDAMKALVESSGGAFYGFAAVDPNRADAPAELERAFRDLGLSGLKLHPAKQRIAPMDGRMLPLYEICQRYNKPIVFHAGLSWQPQALMDYAPPRQVRAHRRYLPQAALLPGAHGLPLGHRDGGTAGQVPEHVRRHSGAVL